MKRISTLFLRAMIGMMTLGVLVLCTLLLPTLWGDIAAEFPGYAYAVYAVFAAMFAAAVPFLLGMYNAWRLLALIDGGKAFTKDSAKRVGAIAIAAGCISAVYIVSMPFFYIWGDNNDAPGLIVIGMVLVGAPMVVAVFASLLYRLIGEAAELKSEHELTV